MNLEEIKSEKKTFSLTYQPLFPNFAPRGSLFLANFLVLHSKTALRVYLLEQRAGKPELTFLYEKEIAAYIIGVAKWRRGGSQGDKETLLVYCEPAKLVEFALGEGSVYNITTVGLADLEKLRKFTLQCGGGDNEIATIKSQEQRSGYFAVLQYTTTLLLFLRRDLYRSFVKETGGQLELPANELTEDAFFVGESVVVVEIDLAKLGLKTVIDIQLDFSSSTPGVYLLSVEHIEQDSMWIEVCQISFLKLSILGQPKLLPEESLAKHIAISKSLFDRSTFAMRCLRKGGMLIFSDHVLAVITQNSQQVYSLTGKQGMLPLDLQIPAGIHGAAIDRCDSSLPFAQTFYIGVRNQMYHLTVDLSGRSRQLSLKQLEAGLVGSIASVSSKQGHPLSTVVAVSPSLYSKAWAVDSYFKFAQIYSHKSLGTMLDFVFLSRQRHFESPVLAVCAAGDYSQLNYISRTAELRQVEGEQLGYPIRLSVAERSRVALWTAADLVPHLIQYNEQGSYQKKLQEIQRVQFICDMSLGGKPTLIVLCATKVLFFRDDQKVSQQTLERGDCMAYQQMGNVLYCKGRSQIAQLQIFSTEVIRKWNYALPIQPSKHVGSWVIERHGRKAVFCCSNDSLTLFELNQSKSMPVWEVGLLQYGMAMLRHKGEAMVSCGIVDPNISIDLPGRLQSVKDSIVDFGVMTQGGEVVLLFLNDNRQLFVYKGRLAELIFYRQVLSLESMLLQRNSELAVAERRFMQSGPGPSIHIRDNKAFVTGSQSGYSLLIRLRGGELLYKNARPGVPLLGRQISLLYTGTEWFQFDTQQCEGRVVRLRDCPPLKPVSLHNLSMGSEELLLFEGVSLQTGKTVFYILDVDLGYRCQFELESGFVPLKVKTTLSGVIAVSAFRMTPGEGAGLVSKLMLYVLQEVGAGQLMAKLFQTKQFSELVTCIDEVGKQKLVLNEGCNFAFVDTSSCRIERNSKLCEKSYLTALNTWPFSDFAIYAYLQGGLILGRHDGESLIEDLHSESMRAPCRICELVFIGRYLKVLVVDEDNNMFLFSITKDGRLEKIADSRLPSRPHRVHKFEQESTYKNFYFCCADGGVFVGSPFYSEENIFLSLEHTLAQNLPELGGLQTCSGLITLRKKTHWMKEKANILSGRRLTNFLQLSQALQKEMLGKVGVNTEDLLWLIKRVLVF